MPTQALTLNQFPNSFSHCRRQSPVLSTPSVSLNGELQNSVADVMNFSFSFSNYSFFFLLFTVSRSHETMNMGLSNERKRSSIMSFSAEQSSSFSVEQKRFPSLLLIIIILISSAQLDYFCAY